MCGRYAIAPTREDAWASVGEILGAHIQEVLDAMEPRFNIAPTTQIPIIVQDPETKAINAVLARWGFIPHWWKEAKPPTNTLNARSEEAHRKPMWRGAWTHSRCLIAATHWYEWRQDEDVKQPFALTTEDGRGFMFAGLYSRCVDTKTGEEIHTAAILTRDASPSVRPVHDRMPVILNPNAWLMWLDPDRRTKESVREVMVEHWVSEAVSWKIAKDVNKVANQGSHVLEPLPNQ